MYAQNHNTISTKKVEKVADLVVLIQEKLDFWAGGGGLFKLGGGYSKSDLLINNVENKMREKKAQKQNGLKLRLFFTT